ncbi:hypothetical protein XBO1_2200004 [Xenorhabdus bovienii str. oregonense]|uniref:Uncharacterized protein n=1 Tax=Xenorhabdus bovienii str. oregonense TaxID=1398202 RepID=A0A077P6Q1_XENBV|nr:hypothetical protein [Xenorhabdus bovienii]CDH06213.1 hypothetical protein XBO1_2200004 [Xenorhabdus bovienii str. oregonense]
MKSKGKISVLVSLVNSFDELIEVVELIFKCNLSIKDMDGRYIAKGNVNKYEIQLIDKEDRSLDILCDEYYTLSFYLNNNHEDYVSEIIDSLDKYNFIWDKIILNNIKEEGDYRELSSNESYL